MAANREPDLTQTVGDELRFVARQPILDGAGRLFAYELLYRNAADDLECTMDDDRASANVLTDGLLAFGLKTLANGHLLFINFTRQWLLADVALLLPMPYVVLELTERIPADEDTLAACRRLRAAGYALALDDFEEGSAAEAFMPYASYVKVDVLTTPHQQVAALAKRFKPRGIRLVAEKVETRAMAECAASVGYELFQGHYFARPTTFSTKSLSPQRKVYLDLLGAINAPDITIDTLETLVKRDPALSHRVLRCLQSASWGLRRDVSSIREALILLGIEPVRRWASVWAVAGLSSGKPTEIVNMALIRARMCEQVSVTRWGRAEGGAHHLLGLCSLLDVMLEQSIVVAIEDLPLQPAIREALQGAPGPARSLLDCVIAYEQGDWLRALDAAAAVGIDLVSVADAYGDALNWAQSLSAVQTPG